GQNAALFSGKACTLQGGFKQKRNRSSPRKEAHFEENQWNRASYSENGHRSADYSPPGVWHARGGGINSALRSARGACCTSAGILAGPRRAFHPVWRTKFMGTHVGCYGGGRQELRSR